MRFLSSLVLTVAISAVLTTVGRSQGGNGPQVAPPGPTAPPPSPDCYRLALPQMPDATQQWARKRVGDKWISGCIGPEGKCFVPVWLPC